MALIKCIECGHEVSDKASYCPQCGAPVEKKRQCTECGNFVSMNAQICPICGFPLRLINNFPYIVNNITSNDFIKAFNIVTYTNVFIDLACLAVLYYGNSTIELISMMFGLIREVMFFYWMYQICKTMKMLNPSFPYKPYWTWLSFLIPGLSLVKPYQIMSAIWKESSRITSKPINFQVLVMWWATIIIIGLYLLWLIFAAAIDDSFQEPPLLYFIYSIMTIVYYFIEMYMIRLYHSQELCFNINN